MNAQNIVEAVQGKKGQHIQAVWSRPAKVKKGCNINIVKRTAAWVRSGVNYSHMAAVKDAIAAGDRDSVGSLPWGKWRDGYESLIIDHNGEEYVRLYPATFDNLKTPHVEWTMDGVPSTYEQVEPYLLASEKRKKEDDAPLCFTLNAKSIIEIAGE